MPSPTHLLILRATRQAMLTHGPTPAEQEAISAHFAYLVRLHADGLLTLAGRSLNNDARTVGIALLIARDDAHAHALVVADPCVSSGIMAAELLPFRVAVPV